MCKVKVENLLSPRSGNPVANQFKIIEDKRVLFQSYSSNIAQKVWTTDGLKITLDKFYWDYSRTTSKYLGQFLGESMATVREKVADGTYKLANLN